MGQLLKKQCLSADREPLLKDTHEGNPTFPNFLPALIGILESLSHEEFRKFLSIISDQSGHYRLPEGKLDGRGRAEVAAVMNKTWTKRLCLTNTRDLLKMIPRNDLEEQLRPYLRSIGEAW